MGCLSVLFVATQTGDAFIHLPSGPPAPFVIVENKMIFVLDSGFKHDETGKWVESSNSEI